jgi:translation initiation factor 2 subunit 2
MDYEKLLKKARNEMPKSVFESERFEIPKVRGHIQGNKTIISNFYQITDDLRRNTEHLLKYILKELATPGNLTKSALILGAKVPASRINEKIRKYASEYVLCLDCGKPDTTIIKEGDFSYLKCQACGAKHQVKSLKSTVK